MIKRLYRVLDESIILGKNQMLIMNTGEEFVSSQDNDYSYLQKLESMIKSRQYDSLKKTVKRIALYLGRRTENTALGRVQGTSDLLYAATIRSRKR